MAEVTTERIRALRERTGAGMMDVKRALEQAGGNEEEAIRILREKGLAQAAKRATRKALEGVIETVVLPERGRAAIIELNCETDFVARTGDFRALARALAEHAAFVGDEVDPRDPSAHADPRGESSVARVDAFLDRPLTGKPGLTARELLTETAARLGEHVRLRRFVTFVTGARMVETYVHGDGRIGVLLEAEVSPQEAADRAEVRAMVRDLAMQVAAFRAEYVDRSQVPEAVKAREREIYRTAALNEGKPERVVDRIVEGRLEKFYQEVCLLDQPYMRDGSVSVSRHLQQASGALGVKVGLRRFARFERAEQLASDDQQE
ncbi:MAG: translation elongation factor Ts [Limnochordaceae bacterium]|nr:translation elongation factor Ts [Limnochordaceae bacterium]